MKTAVMFCGQARTFANCYQLMYWKVLRLFENPTFFVRVADDEQAGTMNALSVHFEDVRVEYVKQPDFPHAKQMMERSNFAGYGLANHVQAHPENLLKAFWSYKNVWEMIPNPEDYDVFVRIRPDLWFMEFEMPERPQANEAITPVWGRFGGVNDRLAIMGFEAARAYMTTLDRVDKLLMLGCPYHPETLTRYSLEDQGITIRHELEAFFYFRRLRTAIHPTQNSLGNNEWLCGEPEAAWHHRLYEAKKPASVFA